MTVDENGVFILGTIANSFCVEGSCVTKWNTEYLQAYGFVFMTHDGQLNGVDAKPMNQIFQRTSLVPKRMFWYRENIANISADSSI